MTAFPSEIQDTFGFSQIDASEYTAEITAFLTEYAAWEFTLEQAYGLWQMKATYNQTNKEMQGEGFVPLTMSEYFTLRVKDLLSNYADQMTEQYTAALAKVALLPENRDISLNQLIEKYPFHILS